MKLDFILWWRRPKDVKKLGAEAVELASLILQLNDGLDLGIITNPVRAGFAHNFETESSAGIPWRQLADRTNREREFLGFPPAHPILERTGGYKHSWITRTASNHFERQHRHGQVSPGGGIIGQNMLTIHVGSIDYRAPIHELGLEMPEHLVERERMLSSIPQSMQGGGSGAVPARPVRFIADSFLDKIGAGIKFLLDSKMNDVKGPT